MSEHLKSYDDGFRAGQDSIIQHIKTLFKKADRWTKEEILHGIEQLIKATEKSRELHSLRSRVNK